MWYDYIFSFGLLLLRSPWGGDFVYEKAGMLKGPFPLTRLSNFNTNINFP